MNRSTFLKRFTGAVAALFVPWKLGAREWKPKRVGSLTYIDEEVAEALKAVCPRCKGLKVIAVESHPAGVIVDDSYPYIPDHGPVYEERPCPVCQGGLLTKLEEQRLDVCKFGGDPKFFWCNRATVDALVDEQRPLVGLDFGPLGEYQTLQVHGMTWVEAPGAPYGHFIVTEYDPHEGPPERYYSRIAIANWKTQK